MKLHRLRELRLQRGETQEEVARGTNLSTGRYRNYELNVSHPDLETLVELAQYFEVSTDYLLNKSDLPFPVEEDDLKLVALIKGASPESQALLRDLSPQDLELLRLIHGLPQEHKAYLLQIQPSDVELILYLKGLPDTPVPYVISDTLIGLPKNTNRQAIALIRDFIEFVYEKYGT